ncbi:MAG: hypothetical protein R2745_02715 [Vicinamibacterales bacterium]
MGIAGAVAGALVAATALPLAGQAGRGQAGSTTIRAASTASRI